MYILKLINKMLSQKNTLISNNFIISNILKKIIYMYFDVNITQFTKTMYITNIFYL